MINNKNNLASEFRFIEDGGICSPNGFRAAGVHAGFRKNSEKLDLALVVADEPCSAAAVFTKNEFCAAPVLYSRQILGGSESVGSGVSYGTVRAVVINSGNANAATGALGLENAKQEADMVSDSIGCPAEEVLVASTGVIGVQLQMSTFERGIPNCVQALSEDGAHDAALAIMTTDTVPKECAVSFSVGNAEYKVGGMAKGSGMIMPNMATMIAVITTDAPIAAPDLHVALSGAVGKSFNKVTVDSDTSTNDSCFLLASGKPSEDAPSLVPGTDEFDIFCRALTQVCTNLARSMARDGEGATRLITVNVSGASSDEDADIAARSIANSPLVKTAVFGRDANWGRIAAALGKSGAKFRQDQVDINILGLPVCKGGMALDFDEEEALKRFEDPEIVIDVNLNNGISSTTVWSCDLTHEYVSINADYRS